MEKKIVPGFYGLRIYLSSIILYFFLVFPFIGFIIFQNVPKFIESRGGAEQLAAGMDSLDAAFDTIPAFAEGDVDSIVSMAMRGALDSLVEKAVSMEEDTRLEMVSGDAISTGFTLQTTTKKGKPFKARLLGKAIIDFNPVTGQLDGQMTYEVEYDGHVSRVPGAITTESRDTPDGKLRGVRADNLFGKKPTKATVVSANRMTLPGGRNLLLVCTENYKVTPKGK